MIIVKHPLEHCNQAQERMVGQAPAPLKRWHELMFSHGNATYRYHQRATGFEPTGEDWNEWLEGIEAEGFGRLMRQGGFEKGKRSLPFTRYVNEKNDLGMDEFVRQLMGQDEYEEYMRMLQADQANADLK